MCQGSFQMGQKTSPTAGNEVDIGPSRNQTVTLKSCEIEFSPIVRVRETRLSTIQNQWL